MLIYKLLEPEEWAEFEQSGSFTGAPIDLMDGYIHLSTKAQVEETARLHFKESADLWLVGVASDTLGEALKWEPARDGSLFPHFYGHLSLDMTQGVWALRRDANGEYEFPETY